MVPPVLKHCTYMRHVIRKSNRIKVSRNSWYLHGPANICRGEHYMYYFDEYTRVCNAKFPAYINMRLGCKAALGSIPRLSLLSLLSNYLQTASHPLLGKNFPTIATIRAQRVAITTIPIQIMYHESRQFILFRRALRVPRFNCQHFAPLRYISYVAMCIRKMFT